MTRCDQKASNDSKGYAPARALGTFYLVKPDKSRQLFIRAIGDKAYILSLLRDCTRYNLTHEVTAQYVAYTSAAYSSN